MKRKKTFKQGATLPHIKNTAHSPTVVMPAPETITVPMQQHIGAPCKPVLQKGDRVKVGQVIGDSDQYVSAPIHSGVSGKVAKMDIILTYDGRNVPVMIIESDGENEIHEDVKPPKVGNLNEFVKAIRASGLVGLGGAGFPTHVKLNLPNEADIDTLIVNAVECEPYITSDFREALEHTEHVIRGTEIIGEFLKIPNLIIGVEDNKPESIEILSQAAKGTKIQVQPLITRYPQGAEKMLISALTGRKVPSGGLPSDVGTIVLNITTVSFISKYLETGMPLVKRRVTVDGTAVKNPGNVEVVVGTSIRELLAFCGGITEEIKKVIMGGPMMGIANYNIDQPILKQNNAILALGKELGDPPNETPCIRCGRCVSRCPMSLMPVNLDLFSRRRDLEMLNRYHIMDCIECGSCTYNCPAKRYLVQSIRMGKTLIRQQPKVKGGK
ncbi:MAG: electron transport complex subunit RsxC [Clostridia bacterium]|jgi:electron transport complex protein RnfC|nr:electron transport complex subunit RsxC [Clostridiaceae bacterium]